jgi:hypothetical protein
MGMATKKHKEKIILLSNILPERFASICVHWRFKISHQEAQEAQIKIILSQSFYRKDPYPFAPICGSKLATKRHKNHKEKNILSN